MEMELEPSVKPLSYKIKGMSRESPSQKAVNVLDTDLRNHWSTGTNTKEWILLELDEPCLLSHIRIYNKSILEWEIAVGLRYKPDAFVKVRPRCEAPRRDMMYPMNYTPCRYVRISCLRGNPIAVFFIQLIGVSMPGLEPEFQPVVNHLLPHIIAHKQNAHNIHLQLLQDITDRLLVFLPHLEADLTSYTEAAESNTRFLAMLAGPFYPILHIVNERETARASNGLFDTDPPRSTQATTLTVSSNFEAQPRRARSPSPFVQPASSSMVFRPDAVLVLLRRAYKESHLGTICRAASRALHKLGEPAPSPESLALVNDQSSSVTDETVKAEAPNYLPLVDYSSLFGEEFKIPDNNCDSRYLNVLDLGVTEEGILHVLFACASQPLLCRKLADSVSDFWSVLPLVQALVPALRPPVSSPPEHFDDSFSQWKQPFVQQALSQITATLSSSVYRPLLHACAGYLSSYSPSHAKAACLLIDLCSGPLAPWISTVIAKVDLAIELLEELLGTIQGVRHSITRARAAIKYIILALSGHMDDVLTKYKEVKHNVLFLLEMLEPFLDPAITAMKNTIAFGDVSAVFLEKQEHNCAIALNIIHMAVHKRAVLPSLEYEWRHGSVAPSVLLSILDPNMALPPEIDLCKCLITVEQDVSSTFANSSALHHGGATREESDGKTENFEVAPKFDVVEDASFLFAPVELKNMALRNHSNIPDGQIPDKIIAEASQIDAGKEGKYPVEETLNNLVQNGIVLDVGFAVEYFNFQADFLQLMNYRDCELRASEFQRLALELHSQPDITPEGHDAVIDALLLAAECYVNPFFMMNFRANPMVISQMCNIGTGIPVKYEIAELRKVCDKKNSDLEIISHLERKRDITVLQILLEAAEMDRKYHKKNSKGNQSSFETEGNEQEIKISSIDKDNADAVTLVRQNQSLLCHFLLQHLQREQHSMHEILMQSLLFFMQCATELFCPPEHVIDIILGYAEHLNRLLTSFYHQLKENNMQLDPEKAYGVQRQWVILQNLAIASSTGEEGPNFTINTHKGYRYKNLIPFSSWMQKVPKFSSSPYPLVRFLGWMAVSRYAKQYLKERLFLASDISQLSCLLSVFADELAMVDHIVKDRTVKLAQSGNTKDFQEKKVFELTDQSGADGSFHVIYPDLHKFFPNMKKQFVTFGEIILEATALQLRSFPSSVIPDILCWLSDLCLWPFVERVKDGNCTEHTSHHLKGYSAKNAKAIILYILEAVVVEHMEAMVPEIPRVVQVLVCLCKASYCDVVFLDSVLCLLQPLISYALKKMSDDEKMLMDDSSCLNFESLCFDELFSSVKYRNDNQDGTKRLTGGALTIYVLGALFPDLSFQRKREILQSAKLWADFTTFEPAPAFFDYLCGFQKVIESCKLVIIQTLHIYGIPSPVKIPGVVTVNSLPVSGGSEIASCFDDAVCNSSFPSLVCGQFEDNDVNADLLSKKCSVLSPEEIDDFSKSLSELINELSPTIDRCWKLHHQVAMKLTLTSAWCYMYSKCLSSAVQKVSVSAEDASEHISESLKNNNSVHWRSGLEGLAGAVMRLQQNRCWQVASAMLDYLLCVPNCFNLDAVLGTLCSVMAQFCCNAPRILWRLQTDKWLSILFMRGIGSVKEDDVPLVDLFHVMLGHPEPEQRSVALKNLGRLVGKDTNGEKIKLPFSFNEDFVAVDLACSVSESVRSFLVLRTWDKVVLLASSDPSILLRIRAMTLLLNFIPFAERTQLQSFLSEADSILHSLGRLAYSVCESPLTQTSLALLSGICLYSPAEDISLIPQTVWRNLETLGMSTSGGRIGDLEKKACQALCRLRTSEDDAKVVLKEFFSSGSASKQSDPDFGSTRESILQVLANLSSVQAYFDIFSKRIDREATELEEAEIEMDLLQKEHVPRDSSENHREGTQQLPFVSAEISNRNRLQQIKDSIRATEKARLREDIVARRQKKLLFRCTRQKHLEEAALREAELLQELDRERTSEMERDIERQRLLELERAKTRELRYNLDIEKERQTQHSSFQIGERNGLNCLICHTMVSLVGKRELQRELEQAESGIRPSRREFSSSTPSRPRDRYRERENGRSAQEGSLRPSSSGREAGVMPPTTTSSTVPTIVLSGSRQFAGQLPTILQSRDRQDERSTIYEDSYEGSKDSGDAGSVGESELASVFDGQSSGFGSSQRHSSRGSKSRQIMERRERDGRREGKWERKH